MDRGARLKDKNHEGITPFTVAWIAKKWDTVAHLLGIPKVIENVQQHGAELLKAAIKQDAGQVVHALLVNLPEEVIKDNVNGMLDDALTAGKKDVARALVQSGADLNHRNGRGFTRLMQAAEQGRAEEVVMLLELGADSEIKDYRGRTALMIATISGKVDVVRRLRQHGAKN
jgi:ankyrin repeat protein